MTWEDLNKLTRWMYGFQYLCRCGRGKERFRNVFRFNLSPFRVPKGLEVFLYLVLEKIHFIVVRGFKKKKKLMRCLGNGGICSGLALVILGSWADFLSLSKQLFGGTCQYLSVFPSIGYILGARFSICIWMHFFEKFGLLSTGRCHNCIDSHEMNQENKYEWVGRLDVRMKVMDVWWLSMRTVK